MISGNPRRTHRARPFAAGLFFAALALSGPVPADAAAEPAPRIPQGSNVLEPSPATEKMRVASQETLSRLALNTRRLKDRCRILSAVNQDRLEATARLLEDTASQIEDPQELRMVLSILLSVREAGHYFNIAPDITGRAGLRVVLLPPAKGQRQPVEILVPGRAPLSRGVAEAPKRQELLGQWVALRASLETIGKLSGKIEDTGPWVGLNIPAADGKSDPKIGWQEAPRTESWIYALKKTACEE